MEVLSADDELVFEKNLVWIFSSRRSGTTWLGEELLSYHTKFLDEPLIGVHLGKFNPVNENIKRTLEVQGDRQDYFFSKPHKQVWSFFLRKLILNRMYDQFRSLSEKIVIKEPSGSLAADVLAECLPNSRIILLMRDPRDVIDSKIDEVSSGGWELELKKGVEDVLIVNELRISSIKNNAIHWVGLMKVLMKTFENHSKDLRYLLRYEDLLTNTEQELEKLYQFLGIDIDKKNLNDIVQKYSFKKIPQEEKGKGRFKRFASPGKWKESFNDKEKEIMNNILKDMLQKVGYE